MKYKYFERLFIYITVLLVSFSDVLSLISDIFHLQIPLNIISTVMICFILIYSLQRKYTVTRMMFFLFCLISIDFLLLYINSLYQAPFYKQIVIFSRQVIYPVFFINLALRSRYSFDDLFFRGGFLFIVFAVAFFQLYLFFMNKNTLNTINSFLSLNNTAYRFSFQTSRNGIIVRVTSIFSSALAFSFYLVPLFFRKRGISRLFVLCILILSFNRAGYFFLLLAIVLNTFRFDLISKINIVVMIVVIGFVTILSGMIFSKSNLLAFSFSDINFAMKISTLFSRFVGWSYIQQLSIRDFFFGFGLIQGYGNGNIYADNYFIYKLFQTGIIGLLINIFIILLLFFEYSRTCKSKILLASLPLLLINNVFYDWSFLLFILSVSGSNLQRNTNMNRIEDKK